MQYAQEGDKNGDIFKLTGNVHHSNGKDLGQGVQNS